MSSDVFDVAAQHARRFTVGLADRPVGSRATREELHAALGGALPLAGTDPVRVVDELARAADAGLVATAGPRFFGFVIGGRLPAALGADWLASAWDQNAGLFISSPAASVVEEIAAGWVLDLLDLPASASVGFVTGGQMANFTALAAARHAVLGRAGWDVEEQGLFGAPPIHVVVADETHVTVFAALRYLGLGAGRVVRVRSDAQGRMDPDGLRHALEGLGGPTIVCAQAGNVNPGAIDLLEEIVPAAHERGAWVHVDGAFGLWAAAVPALRPRLRGAAAADSWSVDAHKWLNVPYDSGLAIVGDPAAHRGAMATSAAYLLKSGDQRRDPLDFVPEFSRRARGFALYAALRSLGREGVTELVERCCRHARRMAGHLQAAPGVQVLNEVVLNQVLVRFDPPGGGDAGRFTEEVIARVQQDGTCWLGGTDWRGATAMRISFSNAGTQDEDVDRVARVLLGAARRS